MIATAQGEWGILAIIKMPVLIVQKKHEQILGKVILGGTHMVAIKDSTELKT